MWRFAFIGFELDGEGFRYAFLRISLLPRVQPGSLYSMNKRARCPWVSAVMADDSSIMRQSRRSRAHHEPV
jgi:hypothetical protein